MKRIIYSFSGLLLVLSSCLLSSCEEWALSPTSKNLAGSWYLTETTQIITCASNPSLDTTLILNDTINTVYTLKKDGSWLMSFNADTTIVGTWTVYDNNLNVDAKYVNLDLLWLRNYTIQKLTSKQLILNNHQEIEIRESADDIPKMLLINETTKFTKL